MSGIPTQIASVSSLVSSGAGRLSLIGGLSLSLERIGDSPCLMGTSGGPPPIFPGGTMAYALGGYVGLILVFAAKCLLYECRRS